MTQKNKLPGGFGIYVSGPTNETALTQAVSPKLVAQCANVFKKELVKDSEALPLRLNIPKRVIDVYINKVKETAAYAIWTGGGTLVGRGLVGATAVAATVLVSGIDEDADHEAITLCREWEDAAGNVVPVARGAYDKIKAEKRPLGALLFVTAESQRDVDLRTMMHGLVQAFFDQFAVDIDEKSFNA